MAHNNTKERKMTKQHTPQNTVQPEVKQTAADQIWNEIRRLPIEMFGLPGQIVEMHVAPTPLDPSRCFLVARASAVLPSLESALGVNLAHPEQSKYLVEQQGNFIVVSRNPAVV